MDLSRLGHLLRVVLRPPADPPRALRRLYSSAGCPLDAAAGSEFLIGDRRETGQLSYLIHDRDGAFLPLDGVLSTEGVAVIKTPPQSPMCNAYAEWFVRETRETLDNLILLGEKHFRHVLKQIEHHHNRHRPHQGLGNGIPLGFEYPEQPAPLVTVRCDAALGGLLNHYYVERAAA